MVSHPCDTAARRDLAGAIARLIVDDENFEPRPLLRQAGKGSRQDIRLVTRRDQHGHVIEGLAYARVIGLQMLARAPRPPGQKNNGDPAGQSGDRPAGPHQATRSDLSLGRLARSSGTDWLSGLS